MLQRYLVVSNLVADMWHVHSMGQRGISYRLYAIRGVTTARPHSRMLHSNPLAYTHRTRPGWIGSTGYHNGRVDSLQGYDLAHKDCNVPQHIAARVGTNIHLVPNHPLNIIKNLIEQFWQQRGTGTFKTMDSISPVVSTMDNFDSLLIPKDHVSRTKSDTYYIRKDTMLRTHTSAHQITFLKAGMDRFLVTGDVYR